MRIEFKGPLSWKNSGCRPLFKEISVCQGKYHDRVYHIPFCIFSSPCYLLMLTYRFNETAWCQCNIVHHDHVWYDEPYNKVRVISPRWYSILAWWIGLLGKIKNTSLFNYTFLSMVTTTFIPAYDFRYSSPKPRHLISNWMCNFLLPWYRIKSPSGEKIT